MLADKRTCIYCGLTQDLATTAERAEGTLAGLWASIGAARAALVSSEW